MSSLSYSGDIAKSLAEDPLYIDPAARPDIRETTVNSLQQALEDGGGVPVYVVIVPADRSDVSDLGTLVAAAREDQGVYLVMKPQTGTVWSKVDVDAADRSDVLARMNAAGQDTESQDPPPVQAVTYVETLRDPNFTKPERKTGTGSHHSSASSPLEIFDSGAGVIFTVVLVPVLILAAGAVVWQMRRSPKRKAPAPYRLPRRILDQAGELQRRDLARELSADSLHIAGRLRDFDVSDLDSQRAELVQHGLDAYTLAAGIVDDPQADRVDLAGALVLLNLAGRDLDELERGGRTGAKRSGPGSAGQKGRAVGSRARRAAIRRGETLCVFDPGHGAAQTTVRGERAGSRAAERKLPACAACAKDLAAGRQPDWLYDGNRPYAEGDSIWARTLFGSVGEDLVAQLQRRG